VQWEITHDTGNMLKQVESSGNMALPQCSIICLGGGIAEYSIWVVILLGVLLVRSDIISNFAL